MYGNHSHRKIAPLVTKITYNSSSSEEDRSSSEEEEEPWEHPEASWERHYEWRDQGDYYEEMQHAFSTWFGGSRYVGRSLTDLTEDNGERLYQPRDPDPEYHGLTKSWRPEDELDRLADLSPDFNAFKARLDEFLDNPNLEKNLNYGRNWPDRLCRRVHRVKGHEDTKAKMLWVIDHCLGWWDGLLD